MNAVGRYEIVRRIGVGGMGEVFFAWAYGVARTRKPVVVKVLRAEMLSEPGAPEMFVEEGRLSLRLSHSNILQVFDFGKADDRYFMAMEYVDGYHLGELRKKNSGRLAPEQAAFIAMEVCLALDYAHRLKDDQGAALHIVHRDVTPSNILISREGEVKLADFGIARSVGRSQHTQAGQIRGKVRYMAPEAARGEALDHRADLFSLGAILFELLTGQRAFEGKGREAILQQVVGSRVPNPSSIAADLPVALDEVVVRATAPKRDERFPDAFAFHRALEGACRKAGFAPSRGSFLEFLRELDSVDPETLDESKPQESAARAAEPRRGRTQSGPMGRNTPSVPEPVPSSPAMATPASSTANSRGVAPQQSPEPGATQAVAPPSMSEPQASEEWGARREAERPTKGGSMSATPGAASVPAWAPSNRGTPSGSAKHSSSTGSVPPPIKGPDTALPTGVASPVVLFTLTVAGEVPGATPDDAFPGAEVSDVPLFEVTRGEGVAVDFRDLERITPKGEQPEFSSTPEPLFPERQSASSEETVVREPTPLEPVNEATIPPIGAIPQSGRSDRFRSNTAVPSFEASANMPSLRESTPVPHEPANEPTVAPSEAAAMETEIRMRPSLDEEPVSAGSVSGSGSVSRSVSVSVSARSMRGRTQSGQVARAAPQPDVVDAPTGDTLDSRTTGDSRDTVDHVDVDDEPRVPAASVIKVGDALDSSGRWRRRGEFPPEPAGIDYPAVRRELPPRTPLFAGAVLVLVVLGGWMASQLVGALGTPKATPTPTPRMTPMVIQTPRIVETPAPTATPIAQAPVRTPVAVATTPVRTPPTPRSTRTPQPTPTAVANAQYGFLVINSQPWSEVRLGNKLLGNTPLKNVRLTSGRHTLTFRNPVSGLEKSVDVEVVANETKPVLVELK